MSIARTYFPSSQSLQDSPATLESVSLLKKDSKVAKSKTWETVNRLFVGCLWLSGLCLGAFRPLLGGGLFSLLPEVSAKNPDLYGKMLKTDEYFQSNFIERAAFDPITISAPFPNLIATPGVRLTQKIDMHDYYQLSNLDSNLELSIRQSNGTSVPRWLSIIFDDFPLINKFSVQGSIQSVFVQDQYVYISSTEGLSIFDISDPLNPTLRGFKAGLSFRNMFLKDNYLALVDAINLTFVDVSNLTDLPLSSSIPIFNPYYSTNFGQNDRYICFITSPYVFYMQGFSKNVNLTMIDIFNPLNPIQNPPQYLWNITWSMQSGYQVKDQYNMYLFGDHAYVMSQCSYVDNRGINVLVVGTTPYFCHKLIIVDIKNPSKPSVVAAVSPITEKLQYLYGMGCLVHGNYLYYSMNNNYLYIYDISQIVTPVLVSSIYAPGSTKLFYSGSYLYVGAAIIDISDIRNPVVVHYDNKARKEFLQNNNYFGRNYYTELDITNAAKRKLTGIPAAADRGLLHLDLIATDGLGNSAVNPFAMHIGEVTIIPVSNQQVYVGNATLFTLPVNTFEFPGASFTYSASLVGGLPLPSFMSFDPDSRTFVFTPASGDQNTYLIQVTADDGYGGFSSTTFDLTVPNRLPFMEQPLSDQAAYSGEPFEYIFASNSFADLDDPLQYTAQLQGGGGLPGWLNFNQAERRFYGTPFGKGIYPIVVSAKDGHGGSATCTFTITIPNSAPIVLNPPQPVLAAAGIPFSYTVNTKTFYDIDNDPLTYSASQLPGFLTFDPATRTFSGTPQSQDAGSYTIILQAQEGAGNSVSTPLNLDVLVSSSNHPPVLIKQIPDISARSDTPFSYSFDSTTFADPDGDTLKYEATLVGGNPLPDGLYFDSETTTFSGMLQGPQSISLSVRAIDPSGAFAINTFTLNILDNRNYPPKVLTPLPNGVATIDVPFLYHIPSNTFSDVNNDPLDITVVQADGKPLPKWLHWDNTTKSLSGTPGPWDKGTFQDTTIPLEAWATDGVGSAKATFSIIVQGQSFWETFITVGLSIGSVAASAIGIYKSRALIWNHVRKKMFSKPLERAVVGEAFTRDVALKPNEVKAIKTYFQGKKISGLPEDLIYEEGKIAGSPKTPGRYTIRIIDQGDYINEEFDLIIKNQASDSDPK